MHKTLDEKHHYAVCDCHDLRHVARLTVFLDDIPQAWLAITMSVYLGFWGRVKAAFRYVFKRDRAGYDSVLLSVPDATAFRDLLNEYVNANLARNLEIRKANGWK